MEIGGWNSPNVPDDGRGRHFQKFFISSGGSTGYCIETADSKKIPVILENGEKNLKDVGKRMFKVTWLNILLDSVIRSCWSRNGMVCAL